MWILPKEDVVQINVFFEFRVEKRENTLEGELVTWNVIFKPTSQKIFSWVENNSENISEMGVKEGNYTIEVPTVCYKEFPTSKLYENFKLFINATISDAEAVDTNGFEKKKEFILIFIISTLMNYGYIGIEE